LVAGVGFTIGQLGEPLTRDVLSAPGSDVVAATIVLANIVLPIAMTLTATSQLRRSSQRVGASSVR
jgi:hypothetical protein